MDAAVFDALPMAVARLDGSGRVVAVNAAWRRLIDVDGSPRRDLVGRDYAAACERAGAWGDVSAADLAEAVRDVLAGRSDAVARECYCPIRGRPFWFRVDVRPLPGGGAVVVHTDVTQQRRAIDEAEAAARLDPLTGLLNRRAFHELLGARLDEAAAVPAALLLIDLDRFKAVNDRYGHAAGDLLLCALARRLRFALRPQDRIARMGGDEFLALIERLPVEQPIEPLVERLRRLLEEPVAVGTNRVEVGASIGAVRLDGELAAVDRVIAEADRLMYADKRERRAAVAFTDELLAGAGAVT